MDWTPAISTTGLFALALYLGRGFIETRLTKSVQHEFDKKIEKIRSDFRTSEEAFKADLRAKEITIAALQNTALSGLATRQAALHKRRLEAVDQIWASFNEMSAFKWASSLMSHIDFKKALPAAAKDPRARSVFEMMGKPLEEKLKTLSTLTATAARPYVSDLAWALYSAYIAIVVHAALRLQMLQTGIDNPEIIDDVGVKKLVKAVLPQSDLDNLDVGTFHHLLEGFESLLLAELRRILADAESDRESVSRAGRIQQYAEEVMSSAAQKG